jgi:hypothetical protein
VDFLQGFFRPKCLQDQRKHTLSGAKISMGYTTGKTENLNDAETNVLADNHAEMDGNEFLSGAPRSPI